MEPSLPPVGTPPPPAAVWQARLAAALDPRARALNDSLPVDRRLWPEELALSRAYASALLECGVLSPPDHDSLLDACARLEADLGAGRVTLEGEDVHSAVESELALRCGDPARRLHTGRSRNDQVATLLRMRVMKLCDLALAGLRELERALVAQARRSGDLLAAAYTHLQPAQPVRVAHWWLAHVAALERDEARFENARQAADLLPLGAGAVGGSPLRYDRARLAAALGFGRLAANSLDAVGDRDFALEYLGAAAVLGVHLSRLAEDLVLWCSPGFGWYRPPDGFSTGSSLLPQKRNPDLFELARAKSGRLIGNAERLAIVLKGLPSGYQKDLQEDKEAVFDTADTLEALLAALAPAVAALEPRPDRMAATLVPDLLAVELADSLVAEGVAFRDAHALVSRLWAAAEQAGVPAGALADAERLAISPHFTAARLSALSAEAAVARRGHPPGAGPESVEAQLVRAEGRLGLGPGEEVPHPFGAGPAAPSAGVERQPGGPPFEISPASPDRAASADDRETLEDGTILRRAHTEDMRSVAGLMADYVTKGLLLPRPIGELYQAVREFHVATRSGEVVACAALRLLWHDLGEVRSLAVAPDHHGRGLGARLVERVVADARTLGLPRVIALTRELDFFERCGFRAVARESLPRKVWTDCVHCPRRHACDEIAVVLDLVPGATARAEAAERHSPWPPGELGRGPTPALPIVS